MTLREFLLKNAPRDEVPRRHAREEWVAAIDRLLAQLRNWLLEAGTEELLDLETLEFEKREDWLGGYHAHGLAIHFGGRTVRVVPVAHHVAGHPLPHAEPGHEKPAGRVDVTNGVHKYTLYRQVGHAGERWLVDERSGLRPLDRGRFEAILQELLS